jgi:hypothetical protein
VERIRIRTHTRRKRNGKSELRPLAIRFLNAAQHNGMSLGETITYLRLVDDAGGFKRRRPKSE